MSAMSRGEDKAKRWQFSIRHLLILTGFVAVVVSFLAMGLTPLVVLLGALALVYLVGLLGLSFARAFSRLMMWLFPLKDRSE